MEKLEQRIRAIEERNAKVELDKAWETSLSRKVSIAVLTYALLGIFMSVAGVDRPWINALVPMAGFILSTLSVSAIRKLWTSHSNAKESRQD